jgi:DNA-binding transcriptional LysR family regulator
VAPTAAGERLLAVLKPAIEDIDASVDCRSRRLRVQPSGRELTVSHDRRVARDGVAARNLRSA